MRWISFCGPRFLLTHKKSALAQPLLKSRSKLGSHLKYLNLTFPSVSFYSGIRNDPAFFWPGRRCVARSRYNRIKGPKDQRQFRCSALAASFFVHSLRRIFISALRVCSRGRTPLYFLVTPFTVRSTAP